MEPTQENIKYAIEVATKDFTKDDCLIVHVPILAPLRPSLIHSAFPQEHDLSEDFIIVVKRASLNHPWEYSHYEKMDY